MKKVLVLLGCVLMLSGCSSRAAKTTSAAVPETEQETSLVARENIAQETLAEETEQETEEETESVEDHHKAYDKNGNYPVPFYDHKEYYKSIKNSKYADYKDAIIVDQVIPNNVTSDYGEQIPNWDFNYVDYDIQGLSSVYEQVPEIARNYAKDGVNTCLSLFTNGGNAESISVTYAAIDNNPGKGWDNAVICGLDNPDDIKSWHVLLVIFTSEQDRALRVALFDEREYPMSDLTPYDGYKGPSMTLDPDTNESFDVIGTMPLGDSSFLNRIKEKQHNE